MACGNTWQGLKEQVWEGAQMVVDDSFKGWGISGRPKEVCGEKGDGGVRVHAGKANTPAVGGHAGNSSALHMGQTFSTRKPEVVRSHVDRGGGKLIVPLAGRLRSS